MATSATKLLTPDEAASILRCSSRHIRRLVADGAVPAVKLSPRKRLIPLSAVRAMVRESLAGAHS